MSINIPDRFKMTFEKGHCIFNNNATEADQRIAEIIYLLENNEVSRRLERLLNKLDENIAELPEEKLNEYKVRISKSLLTISKACSESLKELFAIDKDFMEARMKAYENMPPDKDEDESKE